MTDVPKPRKRPLSNDVKKFIGDFPDLYYNGAKVVCKLCDKQLLCWDKYDCKRHVESVQHKDKKHNVLSKTQFIFDLLTMLIVCDVPVHLLDKKAFHDFWNKYNVNIKLPSRRTLLTYLPIVREDIENRIKAVVNDKQLWLCVDETTDRKKHSIVNIIVRVLDPVKSTFPILLASKRLEKCTSEVITKVVLDTLQKFQVSTNQLLMFMSDGAANAFCRPFS